MKKTVEAWALIRKTDKSYFQSSDQTVTYKTKMEAADLLHYKGLRIIPCTVTYEIPKKRRMSDLKKR